MAHGRIEIGCVAMRDPKSGAFLRAEPIYAERDGETDAAEEKLCREAGRLFASIYRTCMETRENAGVAV